MVLSCASADMAIATEAMSATLQTPRSIGSSLIFRSAFTTAVGALTQGPDELVLVEWIPCDALWAGEYLHSPGHEENGTDCLLLTGLRRHPRSDERSGCPSACRQEA